MLWHTSNVTKRIALRGSTVPASTPSRGFADEQTSTNHLGTRWRS